MRGQPEKPTLGFSWRTCGAVAVLGWLAPAGLAGEPPAREEAGSLVAISADPINQSALAEIAQAPDRATRDARISRVVEQHAGRGEALVEQLLLFAAQGATDEARRTTVGQVLRRLDLPKPTLVAALAPQLENRDDAIRRMAGDLLRESEDRSADRPPDFSGYRAVIEAEVRAGKSPPETLVAFMFGSDAGAALRTMVRACQLRDPAEIRSILWAEHAVSELFWQRQFGFVPGKGVEAAAREQLDKLSRHERWWARLYVAQVAASHSELGSPELLARLRGDSQRLVQRSIEAGQGDPRPGEPRK